jgi:hypothetical protein
MGLGREPGSHVYVWFYSGTLIATLGATVAKERRCGACRRLVSTQLYPARAPEHACITVSPLTFQSMSLTGSFHDQVPPNGQPLTVTIPLKCPKSVPLPSVVGSSPWRLIRCSHSFSAIVRRVSAPCRPFGRLSRAIWLFSGRVMAR